jgi:hypothetical protein
MMQKEFEDRANFKVSTDCYHKLIEPEYNASNLDKDEWVKEWKKQGGIQKAYEWEQHRREAAEKEAKHELGITEEIGNERDLYKKKAENLQKSASLNLKELQETEEELSDLRERYETLAETLIGKAAYYNDEELMDTAKAILGDKRYISFKLHNNLELTEEDKELILSNMK